VAKDEPRAAALFKKACDHRDAVACFNIAWMYQNGFGVAKDKERAAASYKQACDAGYEEGCKGLASLR
jgi:TPR repeat protein